ncbi:hypothetical protein HX109_10720 [Galbibacter sp. BG1]|uniref:hypothetical protein n=1 Tax=Galbibacter sp. BG1 TaxID=1170699 RepID=UPI0015BB33E7|nr:hypothetical protein [Galbibacter sp. BG1]QLE02003.1 hypothetical protein HX109_10720 [Galbibacter sp. BG1]
MKESLDKFGQLIVKNMRDKQLDHLYGLLEGKWRAKETKSLQGKLSNFNEDERKTLLLLVDNILTHTMHDLLFVIQSNNDMGDGLKVLMDGENVAEISDGLQGEIFGDEGWIKKFSKYKPKTDNDPTIQSKGFLTGFFRKKSG